MNVQQLLDEFDYSSSPNFLRRAVRLPLKAQRTLVTSFEGKHAPTDERRVCTAPKGADSIETLSFLCVCVRGGQRSRGPQHSPFRMESECRSFILIVSQGTIRLHSGFRFEPSETGADSLATGVLRIATTAEEVLGLAESFRAERIDDGTLWQRWAPWSRRKRASTGSFWMP